MMINAHWRHLSREVHDCEEKPRCYHGHPGTKKAACCKYIKVHGCRQSQKRNEAGRELLSQVRAKQGTRQHNQHAKRNVDQTRPVHVTAIRRIHAILRNVPPALPGHPVADLNEAHLVIGTADFPSGNILARYEQYCARRQQPDAENQP